MNEYVKKWLKRKAKEGPFYIFEMEPIEYFDRWEHTANHPIRITKTGFQYNVIWKYNDKVRIGVFRDGMYTRYGVATWGTLSYPYTVSDFWQVSAGTLNHKEIIMMMDVAKGKTKGLPIFDINTLQDLKH